MAECIFSDIIDKGDGMKKKKTTKAMRKKRSKKTVKKKASKKALKQKTIKGIWNDNNAKFMIKLDHYKIGESDYFLSLGAIDSFLRFVKEKKYTFLVDSENLESENKEEFVFVTRASVRDSKGEIVMSANGHCRREHNEAYMPYPYETAETISYGRACKKLGFGHALNIKEPDSPEEIKKKLASLPKDLNNLFTKLEFAVKNKADLCILLGWNYKAIQSKLDEIVSQRMGK